MQGALAERHGVAVPLSEEEERRLSVVDRPRRRPRRRPFLTRPGVLLVFFAICLALLGVGRVTLSFAVVQESLDTDKLVSQQRSMRQANAALAERLAQLSASTRVHNLAVSELGLVAPRSVVYLPKGQTAIMTTSSSSTTGTTGTLTATTSSGADATGTQTVTSPSTTTSGTATVGTP